MKRFTDTAKWRDSWFHSLKPEQKLALFYVLDNCDNAGVYDPNPLMADFSIGMPVDWETFMDALGPDRVRIMPNGKWHLLKFVEFQCGELNDNCIPHRAIINLESKHGIKRLRQGYSYPTRKGKGKGNKGVQGEAPITDAIWQAYPLKVGKKRAVGIIERLVRNGTEAAVLLERTRAYAAAVEKWPAEDRRFVPHPSTWFGQERFNDDPTTWERKPNAKHIGGHRTTGHTSDEAKRTDF